MGKEVGVHQVVLHRDQDHNNFSLTKENNFFAYRLIPFGRLIKLSMTFRKIKKWK